MICGPFFCREGEVLLVKSRRITHFKVSCSEGHYLVTTQLEAEQDKRCMA